jgi:hypothetical protein
MASFVGVSWSKINIDTQEWQKIKDKAYKLPPYDISESDGIDKETFILLQAVSYNIPYKGYEIYLTDKDEFLVILVSNRDGSISFTQEEINNFLKVVGIDKLELFFDI